MAHGTCWSRQCSEGPADSHSSWDGRSVLAEALGWGHSETSTVRGNEHQSPHPHHCSHSRPMETHRVDGGGGDGGGAGSAASNGAGAAGHRGQREVKTSVEYRCQCTQAERGGRGSGGEGVRWKGGSSWRHLNSFWLAASRLEIIPCDVYSSPDVRSRFTSWPRVLINGQFRSLKVHSQVVSASLCADSPGMDS